MSAATSPEVAPERPLNLTVPPTLPPAAQIDYTASRDSPIVLEWVSPVMVTDGSLHP